MASSKSRVSEDWLAVYIGVIIIALSLVTMSGVDLLGWAAKSNVWIAFSSSVSTV